jgi:uncharacterized protein (TIGR02996 family)
VSSSATRVALEAALLADPEPRAGYEVLADWLVEQGDPHGELIAVQLAREDRPEDMALIARERALLEAHEAGWLGGLAEHGLVPSPTVAWRRGFVDRAHLPTTPQSDDSAHAYRDLIASPVALLLRELELGIGCSYGGNPPDDVAALQALCAAPPPLLRALTLGNFEHQLSWTHVGDVSAANAALARLEELTISAGRMTLGAVDLPRLRRLRLESGGLRAHVLRSIARAAWPCLEHLTVYLGTALYGGDCTSRDVERLLAGANLPRVTQLGVCNVEWGDELAELVAAAPILPRLEMLDLSLGTMGAAGAATLLRESAALVHLRALDLRENYIPIALCNELVARLPCTLVHPQRLQDGDERYVVVSE